MSVTTPATPALSFERLVTAIGQAHAELTAQATRAVNASLTLRNWLIGFHIEEYERRGVDRQQYGEKLLDRLSESLIQQDLSFTHFAELIAVEDDTRRAFEQPLAPGALREASIRPIACGESGSSEGDH